ncbi:hypothetical protein V6N13_100976 [Hibiscus sabdariffa]|uniref:Uncharacterized protein n=1 Tax=Hibiscus sabdariffa TaxID=183260 RepID=A0ABR2QKL7_9ROSI
MLREHGKNCPVPKKDGHYLSGDVSMYEHTEKDADDNDRDFEIKGVEPEHGKICPVYDQKGCCSRGDVSMQENAVKLKVNLETLSTDSLRRRII